MTEYPIDALILSHMQPGIPYRRSRIRFILGPAHTSKRAERAIRRMGKAGLISWDGQVAVRHSPAEGASA